MEIGGVPHVFAAISRGADEASDIVVWQKATEKSVEQELTEAPGETWHAFKDALEIIMCIATIAFIWQNLGVRIHVPWKMFVLTIFQLNPVVMERVGEYVQYISGSEDVS
jgi:hypothetical protein